ncbi:hypothetical protein DEO72_LG1g3227 [Vigna unguiculata]|uniref:VQ domain-containing protein n=1 Tax=Vigna unguiculata TaxID=3917 RepID=A0A4D6KPU4_VIGUN|nr:hypothetical protein DEO72_LG1g3227 [Vigna unguiculata]
MGRKTSQASPKISKDEPQKHQFKSLIKVLRPKVYITDSSSFKKLVQELTGNGSPTTLSPRPPPPPLEPNIMIQNCPFVGTQSHSSDDVSVSPDANSPELCYDALMNEEFNQVCNELSLDDLAFQESVANIDHLLAYQNFESLMFDVEQNPLYSYYEQMEQPDVSIYDYELSGLL